MGPGDCVHCAPLEGVWSRECGPGDAGEPGPTSQKEVWSVTWKDSYAHRREGAGVGVNAGYVKDFLEDPWSLWGLVLG